MGIIIRRLFDNLIHAVARIQSAVNQLILSLMSALLFVLESTSKLIIPISGSDLAGPLSSLRPPPFVTVLGTFYPGNSPSWATAVAFLLPSSG
jgi:hypothetical protein